MSLDDLTIMMPPHEGAGAAIDWAAAEHAYGVIFPSDYRAFMARYGVGTIENYLTVLAPGMSGDGLAEGPMAFITGDARGTWEDEPGPLDAPAERLLAWGCDGTGDLLCWLTQGDVPEAWPVVVYNRGDDAWHVVDCGVVEFLVRILRAEFDELPLSGTPLWGEGSARFLTEAAEARIKAAGQDPWAD
ncbi:SMI1/KNR4 family protein [Streptomyces sp900116325]|uniref:SMI1/KNR4 family protein n=1 Tax=Streptomyces sp. 900116325 TaxID=3154295 RepID=UPI0033B0064F